MLHLNNHTLQEPYILIADGDQESRMLLQDCFQHLHFTHQLKTLADAETLLAILDATPDERLLPTLIVLDLHLPHLGGETTLMLLKKDPAYKQIPVIVYAASLTDAKEQQLLTLGANLCKRKPITIDGMHWLAVELMELSQTLFHSNRPKERLSKNEYM